VTIPETVTLIGNYAFDGCSKLTSVTYLGTKAPTCNYNPFQSTMKIVCVPINYTSSSFCRQTVYTQSSNFDDIREWYNHCYEVKVCGETNYDVQKRENASEWEARTTGCLEYLCNNESGPVLRNKCINDDGSRLTCLNDECVGIDTLSEKGWSISFEVDGLDVDDFDAVEVRDAISLMCGIEQDKIMISTEVDDFGKIVRIFVVIDDANYAELVRSTVEGCISQESSSSVHIEGRDDKCDYGFLQHIRKIQVSPKTVSNADDASRAKELLFILFTTLFMILII